MTIRLTSPHNPSGQLTRAPIANSASAIAAPFASARASGYRRVPGRRLDATTPENGEPFGGAHGRYRR
jgi:hypothetical protein